MMPNYRNHYIILAYSVGTLWAAPILDCQQPGAAAPSGPAASQIVAEGSISSPGLKHDNFHAFLPVTIHGRTRIMVLDLGAPVSVLSIAVADTLGVHVAAALPGFTSILLDSLVFGSTVLHNFPLTLIAGRVDPSVPDLIGILGTPALSQYDVEFDGIASRFRVYARPAPVSPTPARARLLPAGWNEANCVPMLATRESDSLAPGATLQVDGHPLPMLFDSGSPRTIMNVAAAKVLGLRKSSPNVSPLPRDSAATYTFSDPQRYWRVTGLTLQLGQHQLAPIRIQINQQLGGGDDGKPAIALGMDAIRGRRLLVSYETRQLCVDEPRSKSGDGRTGQERQP